MTRAARTRLTLLVLLALTALRIPVALLVQRLLPDVSVAPEANYAAAMLQSLLLFALPGLLLKPDWQPLPHEGRAELGWVVLTICGAVAARGVITPVNSLWMRACALEAATVPVPESIAGQIMMVLALAVVPAIAEELFFRGALLSRLLLSGSHWQAALLTTLMFALMHGSLAGLPGHLIISLLLTLLMMHSGRLIVPIGAHMLFNLLAFVWPEEPGLLMLACGVLLMCVLVMLLVKLPRGKQRRLETTEVLLCGAILLLMAAQYVM